MRVRAIGGEEDFLPVVLEYIGRPNVLRTHPLSKTIPCVICAEIAIPSGKKTRLLLDVANNPGRDWNLQIKVNSGILHNSVIGPDTTGDDWKTVDVDLSEFAGRKVRLELVNGMANTWVYEYGYWGRIEIVSEAK